MSERRAIIARRLVQAARTVIAFARLSCYHTKRRNGRRFFLAGAKFGTREQKLGRGAGAYSLERTLARETLSFQIPWSLVKMWVESSRATLPVSLAV
jgi:hypothetical protein